MADWADLHKGTVLGHPEDLVEKCGSFWMNLRCDLERGHAGDHNDPATGGWSITVKRLCKECRRDLHGYRGPRCRYCDGMAE
jgi:hypothetical protein